MRCMKPDDGEKGIFAMLVDETQSSIHNQTRIVTKQLFGLRINEGFFSRPIVSAVKLTLGTLGNGMPTLAGSSAKIIF